MAVCSDVFGNIMFNLEKLKIDSLGMPVPLTETLARLLNKNEDK